MRVLLDMKRLLSNSSCATELASFSVAITFAFGALACQPSAQDSTGGAQPVVAEPSSEPPQEQAAAATAEDVVTAELMVHGVSCASCTVGIRKELKQLDGVKEVRAGESKSHVLVDFRPGSLTPESLVEAVVAAGYEAEVMIHERKI